MIKNQQGQVVIIILLLMAVALTVGLSISSQTASDVKISTQLEESERAFAAAEAGIESVLSGGSSGTVNLSNNASYNVSITTFEGGHELFVFPKKVSQDDTKQLWLVAHDEDGDIDLAQDDYSADSLTIYWGDTDEVSSPIPAIEATLIYKDTDYQIEKYTFDPDSSRTSDNNFSSAGSDGYTVGDHSFQYRGIINDLASVCPTASCTRYALRIRLLYNHQAQPLAVQAQSGQTFHSQGRQIDGVGTSGGTTRKVYVFESYPSLPAVFDYVLFSGTNLTK